MQIFWSIFGLIIFFALVALAIAFIGFRMAFYAPRKNVNNEEFKLPKGKIYEAYRDTMIEWIKEVRAMPHEDVWISSFDGLRLHGKYYECNPGAPIELMFHGYRGSTESDLCGGVKRCFTLACTADKRLVTVPGAGHGLAFMVEPERYLSELRDFFKIT